MKEREISFLNSHVLESANHKVIVLLDRSPKFAVPTSAADISFVVRDDQGAPINGKFRKTLWNCSTETIMEFHRVVSDMFQRGHKQIRVVISDFVGKFLTGPWSDQLITHDELLKAMMGCAPPEVGGDASSCSIRNGLLCALEAIGERTPLQKSVISSLKKQRQQQPINGGQNDAWPRFASRVNVAEIVKQSQCSKSIESNIVGASPSASQSGEYLSHEEGEIQDIAVEGGWERTPWNKDTSTKNDRDDDRRQRQDHRPPRKQRPSPTLFQNKGTIVVVTSIGSSSEFDAINEYIAEQILDRNEASRRAGDSSMIRIDNVDVYVLNILAGEDAAKLSSANLNLKKRRPLFTSRLISVTAGPQMIPGIHKILQKIYDLVSTTVSGIPMKEETQSGQSVNYDVEMLHPRTTHFGLSAFGMLEPDSSKMLDSAADHAQLFRSVRLKWCTATAKLKSEIFPLLQDSFPITPAHVNNRASVCLTTFILNGKNVMLEVQADAYHQQELESAALGPNLKEKLISHYLSRGVNGSLIIHIVGIGPRATLNGLLSSDRPYGDTAADELRTRLNCRQLSLLAEAVPIQPIPLPITNKSTEDEAENKNKEEGEEFEEGNHNDDYAELFERINLLAGQKLPFRLRDSFVFNIPEKFEPILTVLAKPELSPEQMEGCRAQIREMAASVAARNGSRELTPPLTDKVFPCTLFKGGTSAGTTKEEQIKVALAELGRLLQQFASLSAMHSSLLAFFCETTGLRLSAGVEPQQQPTKQQEKPSRKRQFPVESDTTAAAEKAKVDEELLMQQRIERRRAQVAALWAPGEEINLFDWWKARYEQEVWSGWKGEFEGHRKYGDKAQDNLYPNLNLKLPPGQSKGAGTGTAGPIE